MKTKTADPMASALLEIMEGKGKADINELLDAMDAREAFPGAWYRRAVDRAKKAHIRYLLKKQRSPEGLPKYGNVEERTAEGGLRRVYKQTTLFDLSDFKQVCKDHHARHRYHQDTRDAYARKAARDFGVHLEFDFTQEDERGLDAQSGRRGEYE